MMFKLYDTYYKEWVEDFVIEPDGQVLIADDRCGACDQSKYHAPEYEVELYRDGVRFN